MAINPKDLITHGLPAGLGIASLLGGDYGSNDILRQQRTAGMDASQRANLAGNTALDFYTSLLRGEGPFRSVMAPSVNAINSKYDQAYKNIVNNAYTRGGALDKGLRSVEVGRAMTLSDLYGQAQLAGASGLASLMGIDASSAAQNLADAQRTALSKKEKRGEAFNDIGGTLVKFLTGGLFGGDSDTDPVSIPGGTGPQTSAKIGLPAALGKVGGAIKSGLGTFGKALTTGNPYAIAAIGAGALGAFLIGRGQAHRKADEWVGEFQNSFDSDMASVNDQLKAGRLDPNTASLHRSALVKTYLDEMKKFAAKGGDQDKVARQAMNTFIQWYGDPRQYGYGA